MAGDASRGCSQARRVSESASAIPAPERGLLDETLVIWGGGSLGGLSTVKGSQGTLDAVITPSWVLLCEAKSQVDDLLPDSWSTD